MKILNLSRYQNYWITGNRKFSFYSFKNVYCYIDKKGNRKINCRNNRQIIFMFKSYVEFKDQAEEIFVKNGYKRSLLVYSSYEKKERVYYDPNKININPHTINLDAKVIIPKKTNKDLLQLIEDLYKNGYRTMWYIHDKPRYVIL